MGFEWLRLELDITTFDSAPFEDEVRAVHDGGIALVTLDELGADEANLRRLYALNAECAADIPERGPFHTWEDYRRLRIDVPSFDPAGLVVALDGEQWVGLAGSADHRGRGYLFNEITGVVRSHRRRGIALALKLHGMDYVRRSGVRIVRTVHHPANTAIIALNRQLGYTDATWPYPDPTPAAPR
ncbi:MAG: GNAT family N-acetyltransferase [Ilumatobacteraceae bacterium]